eukprot:Gb_03140 [translate_table: standard]
MVNSGQSRTKCSALRSVDGLYGDIFKTHILGCPCIMIANPEAAKFILVNQAHLFKPTFPASKERMIGPQALFFQQGDYHARLRRLVQSSLSPESIRCLVTAIESLALEALESWGGRTINTFQQMKKYSFDVGILSIFGRHEVYDKEDLKKSYYAVDTGYNSMPINLPGTLFNKAMKAREHLSDILSKIIAERRAKNVPHSDLLGTLMKSRDESSGLLSDDQIADNIIGVIFAAQDTTASVLTWIVKYLMDYPLLLEAVKAEQQAIRQAKCDGETSLTWADTKKMPLTSRVIQETLRVATIISFTFREAVQDKYSPRYSPVFFQSCSGFHIPKGWKVMPLFRNIHHSSEIFSEPQKFDPSRFEASFNIFITWNNEQLGLTFAVCTSLTAKPPKPNTFLAFGNGAHACPGSELAKLEMLILIHYLTTNYRHGHIYAIFMRKRSAAFMESGAKAVCIVHRWDRVGTQNGIQYGPFPVPMEGLPIKVATNWRYLLPGHAMLWHPSRMPWHGMLGPAPTMLRQAQYSAETEAPYCPITAASEVGGSNGADYSLHFAPFGNSRTLQHFTLQPTTREAAIRIEQLGGKETEYSATTRRICEQNSVERRRTVSVYLEKNLRVKF